MGRAGWVLVVVGVLAALEMLASALAGHFSTSNQIDVLEQLGIWGFVAFILLEGIIRGFREFQEHKDWSGLAGLVPVTSILVIVGGLWLWWVYFARHHASIIWLAIVGGAVAALMALRRKAEKHWLEQRREILTKMPDPPSASGSANPKDFKDW